MSGKSAPVVTANPVGGRQPSSFRIAVVALVLIAGGIAGSGVFLFLHSQALPQNQVASTQTPENPSPAEIAPANVTKQELASPQLIVPQPKVVQPADDELPAQSGEHKRDVASKKSYASLGGNALEFEPPRKSFGPGRSGPEPKKDVMLPFIPNEEIVSRVRKAGGQIGKVTISLAWKNRNDLDLHVLTSQGEDICFHHTRSRCGGMLDVDQNVQPTTMTPVENVFWPAQSPPKGPLKIYVHHYCNHRLPDCTDPTRFIVRVQVDDDVKTYEGEVSFRGISALPRAPAGMTFVAEVPIP
jgi:hypothetical protein